MTDKEQLLEENRRLRMENQHLCDQVVAYKSLVAQVSDRLTKVEDGFNKIVDGYDMYLELYGPLNVN